MAKIAILIPAAGSSSRMRGGDKLLETVDGQALLVRQVTLALGTGAEVLATLPPDRPARRAALKGIARDRLEVVTLKGASEGIAASIRAGADWADKRGASGLMIMLADMPDLELADLNDMLRGFDGVNIIRATDENGTPGHPVIFPARLFGALALVRGDQGARAVLQGETLQFVPLPAGHALTDLDTPEDWAAWRQKTGR